MSLVRLDVVGLRNLAPISVEPHPRLNLLVGANASGKTSLLEAVYLLARARSFRTSQIGQLIRFGASELTVAGRVAADADAGGGSMPIGIRIGRRERELQIGGRPAQSSAELLQVLPLLVIQPAGIALIDGAPKLRRQFLDFGVFHRQPGYLDVCRRYAKALHQRNALLRAGQAAALKPWDRELARYGIMMHEARGDYLERLTPFFNEIGGRFFSGSHFALRMQPGWDLSLPLAMALENDVATDLRHGHTQSGPHKGDFSVLLDQRPVKAYVSRGQMKLLVYALLLAQSRLMEERIGTAGCVLIDDVASELDENNKNILLELLRGRPTQFFITATSREAIADRLPTESAVFEMAQGRLSQA